MTTSKIEQDLHFPSWALDNPIRKLFNKPQQYNKQVKPGMVIADLGCGPGYYSFELSKIVGSDGRVYAVDSDEKAIRAVEKKIVKRKIRNIEPHIASAANIGFIEDASVDFVLADGLLCCVAPREHAAAVNEIKRILKPQGTAFLQTGRNSMSYVNDAEWETILTSFTVKERNYIPYKGDRWAWVTKL
jgi:ubiquinone/menaquinone biosynthesis C-methylase UbiE